MYKVIDKRGTDSYRNRFNAGPLYPTTYDRVGYRPRHYSQAVDSKKSINDYNRTSLVAISRELFSQLPSLGGAIIQKNQWSFSENWTPFFTGEDKEWGDIVADWLVNSWFPICNVRGNSFDFRTSLYLDGLAMDVDGDGLMILVTTKDGFPLLQFIPSHRIGSRKPEEVISEGPYKGLRIIDGVIVNDNNRPVAYRILGDKPEDDVDISARNAQLLFEPEWSDQIRGIPRISRTLLDWADYQDVVQFLKRNVKLDSSLGIVHYNETGQPDDSANIYTDDAPVQTDGTGNVTGTSLTSETLQGGEIYYMKADGGGKIEPIRTDRPHTNVMEFLQKLESKCLYAVGWPVEMLDPSKVGGASVRLISDLARKSIKSRQQSGLKRAKLAVAHAVSKAMALGVIPENYNDKWWSFDFQMPASLVVDAGYENQADRENLKIGIITLSDIASKNGKNWYDVREQTSMEVEDLLQRAKAIADKNQIPLEMAINLMSMRQPNGMSQPPTTV